MYPNRKPTEQEKRLPEVLIKKSSIIFPINWQNNLLVRSMEDGAMGSVLLFPNGIINNSRLFGKQVNEIQFKDEDDIEVIASLNIDDSGGLFELDIWKTDFSPLIRIPEKLE